MVKKIKSCLNGIPRPPVEPVSVYFSMEDVQLFITSSKVQTEGNIIVTSIRLPAVIR